MRKGLGFHNRRSPGNYFTPAALFPSGTAGAWYDPSDASTLFSDTAGTTPSPTPGAGALSVVGLMLDKSQGLALGSELITPVANQDFSSDTGYWIKGVGVTISGGAANFSAASGYALYRGGVLPTGAPGAYYEVTFTVINYVSGSIRPYLGVSPTFGTAVSANGTYTQRFCPTSGGEVGFNANVAFTGSIDNVSIKQVSGNHAISYNTTTARPVLSARVNLLTYSENLNGTGWSTLFGGTGTTPTITSNYATAPDGTVTASRFVGTRGASNTTSDYSLSVSPNGTVSSGASYVGSVYIKSNTGSNQNVTLYVNTGAAVQQIVAVAGSTWTRVAPAALTATTTTCNIIIGTRGGSYGGDQSLDILVWGADLRPANIGTSVPAYQRIADAYTYDSSGFPRYLVFNGTASGMYTPANLNLSGTDKATVFAGVREFSSGAQSVAELSASSSVNAGSFVVGSGSWVSGGNRVGGQIAGTSMLGYDSPANFAPPLSLVIANAYDIAGATTLTKAGLRINSVVQSPLSSGGSGTTGTGNFGTYPLYIGSRNNTSNWLNGYIYSLIVVGVASTAAQISSTESWINVKEGGVY